MQAAVKLEEAAEAEEDKAIAHGRRRVR